MPTSSTCTRTVSGCLRSRHVGLGLSGASDGSPFLVVIYFSALPSPSISTSAIFDASPSPFRPQSSPPGRLACLSLRQKGGERKKKLSLRLSINVLSLDFLFPSVYLSVWRVGSCLGAPGLLSAKCCFLFFCQFTCLSERLRLDVST